MPTNLDSYSLEQATDVPPEASLDREPQNADLDKAGVLSSLPFYTSTTTRVDIEVLPSRKDAIPDFPLLTPPEEANRFSWTSNCINIMIYIVCIIITILLVLQATFQWMSFLITHELCPFFSAFSLSNCILLSTWLAANLLFLWTQQAFTKRHFSMLRVYLMALFILWIMLGIAEFSLSEVFGDCLTENDIPIISVLLNGLRFSTVSGSFFSFAQFAIMLKLFKHDLKSMVDVVGAVGDCQEGRL